MDMTRIRLLLAALLIVAAGAGTASAQVSSAITSRTPSRGDVGRRHDGRDPGQRLVLASSTTVDMSGAGTQPTHRGRRPERSPPHLRHPSQGARRLPIEQLHHHGHLGLHHPHHQLHLRRQGPERRAGRAQAGLQLRRAVRRLRVALRAGPGDTNGEIDIYVRNRNTGARAPGQRVVDRRPGARRREHQPGDQRQRPLRRLPVAGDQPGAGRHQRPEGHLRPRPRRRRQRRLRRAGEDPHRARQPRPDCIGATAVLGNPLGGDSSDPAISGNGRYVAFQSAAVNLLAGGDPNQKIDVFVFDRARRVTLLMSTNANNVPRRRPQPQPGDEPERPLRGVRIARQQPRRRPRDRRQPASSGLRHLPARPRHRRERCLRRERRTGHGARQPQPVRFEPDQPQHRSVDHLRRPLRGLRHRGWQCQGRRQLRRRRTSTGPATSSSRIASSASSPGA